jgi:hypothetical protein
MTVACSRAVRAVVPKRGAWRRSCLTRATTEHLSLRKLNARPRSLKVRSARRVRRHVVSIRVTGCGSALHSVLFPARNTIIEFAQILRIRD